MHWKAKVIQGDVSLLKSRADIADLKDQNKMLIDFLSEVKSKFGSAADKAKIEKLEKLNTQLVASSEKVQESVENTISANSQLVQKTQTSPGAVVVTWGIVYGGDQSLDGAKYEVKTIAPKLGLANAAIYYRRDYYRSVATTTDRLQAEQVLNKAKERRKDSYIVNMSTWCPSPTEKDGYFECSNP